MFQGVPNLAIGQRAHRLHHLTQREHVRHGLSFSFDRERRRSRQSAPEAGGFDVVSVLTAGQAWFEIDMGVRESF